MRAEVKLPDKAVDRLQNAGYGPEGISVLLLAPFVRLIWAEGDVQEAERKIILSLAAELGVTADHANYDDLLEWLADRPSDALFEEASGILRDIFEILPPSESNELREFFEDGFKRIAEAAPDVGIFRYSSPVTPEEREEIERFNASFGFQA